LDASAAGAAFEAAFPGLTFSALSLDRRVCELVPGGGGERVTLSRRGAWVAAAASFHLTQYDAALALIRDGLFAVVPARAVRLLTWQELEVAVSGTPTIDVDVMRAHTDLEGFRATDATIVFFWRVIEGFSDEERSLFLRFIYGRSRMPQKKWPRRLKLVRRPGAEDQLPLSHTCFASVELSAMTSEDKMRWALLTAIHWGGGILNA
jgi:E3 ubiquitin-protein ligase HECTD3